MRKLFMAFWLLSSSVAVLAQAPPVLTSADKFSVRDAQHALDAIEKQITQAQKGLSDLDLQYLQLRQAQQQQLAQLTEKQKGAKGALDDVVSKVTAGIDQKKWKLDQETLIFSGISPPVEQAKK